ncbi:hypothetical protein VPH35_110152 [Triticum aestivum]|uniref:Pectinesterase inhibitor domain-containing protein n=1 Tax=Triticum turgidum subsp. durum TaxID=4567 RepID=A0A9R0YI63_TRITD|nr:unnamed protein product [Triticum turgidum subsp. durum]
MSTILLLLVASGACLVDGGTSSVINSTCSGGANGYASLYDYCVRTLWADPAAATSPDVTRLAVAVANLTSANVTLTSRFIQGLIGTLEECVTLYKDVNRSAADAFDDLRAGRIAAALPKLQYAAGQPRWCTLALMQDNPLGPRDPIDDENTAAESLLDLASRVTKVVLSSHNRTAHQV